jgi:hypothetical protein
VLCEHSESTREALESSMLLPSTYYSRAPCPYSCARRDRARSGASPRHTGWPDGIVPPTTRSPSPEETRLRPQRSPDTSWLGWAVATFERLR